MSRVDVVIPCYNYARYLRQCVTSVLSQEGVEVRVLIIDDCSTDQSAEVGSQLAAEDSRVEYRRHTVNKKHIATYNEGLLGWAGGDYCVLLSADDLLVPGALSRAARLMDSNPQVGFVYGGVVRIAADASPDAISLRVSDKTKVESGLDWISRVCSDGYNHVISPEVVVRTRLQKEVGGYLPELPHTGDMEMWLRLASRSDVGIIDADQALYRVHGNNMHLHLAKTTYRDFEHHWAAFSQLFEHHWTSGARRDAVLKTLQKEIATRALDKVQDAIENGSVVDGAEFVALAARIYPECRSWKIYSRLKWKLRLGPTLCGLLCQLKRRVQPA